MDFMNNFIRGKDETVFAAVLELLVKILSLYSIRIQNEFHGTLLFVSLVIYSHGINSLLQFFISIY